MSEQTIQSQDISVAAVFQSFYSVPDYQREYVWETDQVEQLLRDIHGEMTGPTGNQAPEYFIGSIVVCPGAGEVLDLIDGQQRMTTLFLILCAIRDRLKALKSSPPGALEPQIAATSTDASGRDQFRYRLDLQYEDSGDVLVQIAQGHVNGATTCKTLSITNIRNAYGTAIAFLKAEFGDDCAAIRSFYGYLTNKVKLIRIQTEDVAKALKIFETINDRGVGLDSMDLLKNLLFMKADRSQFEKLKNTWKEIQSTIYGVGEKPLRFLRYFILSRYHVEILREEEIYDWLSKNDKLCGYTADPLGFAKRILEAARAFGNFVQSLDVKGRKNPYLENLLLLGGKAARQHLILLLAGSDLSESQFNRLAKEVEDLFFTYVITREHTRYFERTFARWSSDLRKVKSDAELDAFIEKCITPVKAELSARFDDAFRRLTTEAVQQYRMRYILAKLTQWVDQCAYGETEGTKWLGKYAEFEIEHIHPQSPCDGATEEFGSSEDPQIEQTLGNLVLVEKSINASLGNKPYSAKRGVYGQSTLLLTRALADRIKVGVNTKIDAAAAQFQPFEVWTEKSVTSRQENLSALARRVWNIPAGTSLSK